MSNTGKAPTTDMLSISVMLKKNTMNNLITSTFTKDTGYLFTDILLKNNMRKNLSQSPILSTEFIGIERKITFKRVWKSEGMNISRLMISGKV